MTIVFAGIAPHDDEIVPELVSEMDEESRQLMNAMIQLSDSLYKKDPDVIVIASPHNLRLLKHIGIISTSYAEGVWETDYGAIDIKVKCDRIFANMLYELASINKLPVILVNYGVAEGELSNFCLDWGTIIPLWFIQKRYMTANKALPPIVLITPSREIPWDNLVKLGEFIVDIAIKSNKKTAFIASADQGHAHDPKGPYGFDKASEEFDKYVLNLVKSGSLSKLLELKPSFIEKAKPDSFWQMLILLGILNRTNLKNQLVVYGCPTYYGMLVATFE